MTAITRNPDEAINNDIATVRDAFKWHEAETGIDPATLPREQQREIALGGLNALDQSGVSATIDAAGNAESPKGETVIGPVHGRLVDAASTVGMNISGYQHSIDAYAVRHIRRQHGNAAVEAARGQLAMTDADIRAIPAAIDSPDAVVFGAKNKRGQDLIASIKSMPDGTMLVVEEVRTKRRTLTVTSARKVPAGRDTDSIARTLLSNAQSDGGDGLNILQSGIDFNPDPAAGGVSDSGAALNQSGDDGFSEEGRKQARDVERAYGGRQGYERDKAAGRTKLTYGQWVQVRTPNFLRWFGDWLALRAQQRLDAMEPVKVRVPEDWRGLSHVELRQKMAEALDRMVRDRTGIEHPELGTIRVGRTGASKSVNTARDPAKSLVAADIEALIPASIYARSEPSRGGDGKDIDGYSTLLARIEVDGIPLIAAFTVRHQSDGQWYYNAVTLHDGNKKARDSYGQPDQDGSSHAPIAGLAEFVRRQLIRVNPAEVSKVIDPKTGEPMVVYHATNGDFNAFSESKRSDGFGYYFGLTEVGAKKAATGKGRIIAAFIKADKVAGSMKTPAADWLKMRFDGIGRRLAGEGFDAAYIKDEARGALVVRNPNQIKSATANNGDFSENPNILKQADGNKKAPRGQIVGRDGQSIIGQKAEDGSRDFNITLFEGKDLSTVLHARRRQGEATRCQWTVQVQHEA